MSRQLNMHLDGILTERFTNIIREIRTSNPEYSQITDSRFALECFLLGLPKLKVNYLNKIDFFEQEKNGG